MSDESPLEETEMDVIVVNPDEVIFEGRARKIIAPAIQQDIALLPHHAPLYALLKEGSAVITQTNGEEKVIQIEGGVIRVKNNKVSMVVGFEVQLPQSSKGKKK